MSIHEFADRAVAGLGGMYGEKMKFFRDGAESAHLTEIIHSLQIEFSPPAGTGEYRIPVRYNGLEGISRYSVLQWEGPDRPTIIFHHGSGETDYTTRVKKTFPRRERKGLNLIAVSVPFNENMKSYLYGTGSLERFAFMFAASAVLIEQLVSWVKSAGSGKIICSGISLGGWITNLHFAVFGSCDEYRPIFAGAAPEDLFINTVYRKMASTRSGLTPEKLKAALNFEADFRKHSPENVYPLMARFDQYIRLERQTGIYLPENITVLEKGHVTGSTDYAAQRTHLLRGAVRREGTEYRKSC